MLVTQL